MTTQPSAKHYDWPSDRQRALEDQVALAQQLITQPLDFAHISRCLAVGVSYNSRDNLAICTGMPCHIDATPIFSEPFLATAQVSFPYIPGLYAYREGPAVLKLYNSLSWTPELIVFDAQGIAHPRAFGLAAHLGVILNCPTLGITRKRLYGHSAGCDQSDRSYCSLTNHDGQEIGLEYRPLAHGATFFASPGHLTDSSTLLQYLHQVKTFRASLPLALDIAHNAANAHSFKRKKA